MNDNEVITFVCQRRTYFSTQGYVAIAGSVLSQSIDHVMTVSTEQH